MSVVAPYALLDILRNGPAPLVDGPTESQECSVAVVIPPFRRGSGGHNTIANLVRGLETCGHPATLWLEDDEARHAGHTDMALQEQFYEYFGRLTAPLSRDFSRFSGADVVLATGWQTVPRVLSLPGARARAYLVQDHEPEFYATSAERSWAEWTYRQGLHCICASPWLAELVRNRYGASATSFDLGVDHATYAPSGAERRNDLVLFYARTVTPRRAVPLGLLALAELHARRPQVEIGLFGEVRALTTPFPHRHFGVLPDKELASAYSTATVGMVLSLTNPSLVPAEMLACGLPVVDLAEPGMLETFGADGPVSLVAPDPIVIADKLEELLVDAPQRAQRSQAGLRTVGKRTWKTAAAQVAEGFHAALRARRTGD